MEPSLRRRLGTPDYQLPLQQLSSCDPCSKHVKFCTLTPFRTALFVEAISFCAWFMWQVREFRGMSLPSEAPCRSKPVFTARRVCHDGVDDGARRRLRRRAVWVICPWWTTLTDSRVDSGTCRHIECNAVNLYLQGYPRVGIGY